MRSLTWTVLLPALLSLAGAQTSPDAPAASTAVGLPADVNPETRSRFPPVRREDMKEGSRKYFDAQPTGGTPVLQRGPQHLYLYSPALGLRLTSQRRLSRDAEGVFRTIFQTQLPCWLFAGLFGVFRLCDGRGADWRRAVPAVPQ